MDYFQLRGIDAQAYDRAPLPSWLVEALKPFSLDSRILDFGCGFGQNIRGIKELGFDSVCGADVNRQAIDHCLKSGLDVHDVSEGLEVLSSGGLLFDVVVTTHVLEHISKDLVIKTLVDLRALLKPGGVLIVAVPNAQAFTGCYWAYEDFTHHTLYTYGSLGYVLRASGFSSITLIDKDSLSGLTGVRYFARYVFTKIYLANYSFWKRFLSSPTHLSSVDVFTYELKMIGRK